jgi:hypothetical protein
MAAHPDMLTPRFFKNFAEIFKLIFCLAGKLRAVGLEKNIR